MAQDQTLEQIIQDTMLNTAPFLEAFPILVTWLRQRGILLANTEGDWRVFYTRQYAEVHNITDRTLGAFYTLSEALPCALAALDDIQTVDE